MLRRQGSSNAAKYSFVAYFAPIADSFHTVASSVHAHRFVAYCCFCEWERAKCFSIFERYFRCISGKTYDVVFDAQALPASAHSASSASRLEYDGVGTEELLLFDLWKSKSKIYIDSSWLGDGSRSGWISLRFWRCLFR